MSTVNCAQGPNFFIVGAPRCGTTALYTYLSQHPDIFMPSLKEPCFFSTDLPVVLPISHPKTEVEYLSLFSGRKEEKIAGEATALYLYSKEAPLNIKKFCPSARIIIMLRNPVDMIYSWHSLMCWGGHECIADFSEALDAEPERRIGNRLPPKYPYYVAKELLCYRELGRYQKYVQRYLEVFQAENVHVIDFVSFKKETPRVLKETCRFLGVNPDLLSINSFPVINENKKHRSERLDKFLWRSPVIRRIARALTPEKWRHKLLDKISHWNTVVGPRPALDPELRKKLTTEFSQDIEALGRLLGRDFRHWISHQEGEKTGNRGGSEVKVH